MSDEVNGARKTRGRAPVARPVLNVLAVTMLALNAVFKLLVAAQVISAMRELGWPTDPVTIRGLGLGLLVVTSVYAVPQTVLVGALLLTGGAVAHDAGIGSPLLTHVVSDAYLAATLWTGIICIGAMALVAFAARKCSSTAGSCGRGH